MSYLKYVKNLGLILIILGHYYFCSYVLSEVHNIKSYEPNFNVSVNDNKTNDEKVENINNEKKNVYLGMVEIPKIGLKRYLYDIDSKENTVNKNVEIIKGSSMPDVTSGNLILAAHNGNTSLGYFKYLYKVDLNDKVIVYYKNLKYVYKIAKKYDVLKTGKVSIKRDKTKNTITLITCLGSDKQLVVIGYLDE